MSNFTNNNDQYLATLDQLLKENGIEDDIYTSDPRYSQLQKVAYDIHRSYLIVLAVIGVPSNVLTVATILSMNALSPATFFVVLLAAFDGSALVLKLIGNQLGRFQLHKRAWLCQFLEPLTMSFATTANWILVLICLERFISVCYPLKKVYLFTKRRSYISAAILVATIFSLIMSLLGVMRIPTRTGCSTKSRFTWFFQYVWLLYINPGLYFFLPFGLISALTGCIIYGLRKSRKHRLSLIRKSETQPESGEEMRTLNTRGEDGGAGRPSSAGFGAPRRSRAQSASVTPTALHNKKMLNSTARVERTITLMLIVAAGIFLVLSLPMCLYQLLSQFYTDPGAKTVKQAQWRLFYMIAFLLLDSTHAVNFFLYFFTAKRFRVQLWRILTGRAFRCTGCLSRRGRNLGAYGTRSGQGTMSKSSQTTESTDLVSHQGQQSNAYPPASSREDGKMSVANTRGLERGRGGGCGGRKGWEREGGGGAGREEEEEKKMEEEEVADTRKKRRRRKKWRGRKRRKKKRIRKRKGGGQEEEEDDNDDDDEKEEDGKEKEKEQEQEQGGE
ncbi:thyrotropin-releasing hormone receptor [Plakobranchus ocellatus]|uniref:Thyrotropin-releasing hormone receptor n=1 Tax=Plakobranchus ocellatus TaxID=259542 RepID=A0AAV4BPG8_9GAST|nr:thyrotropin-releasing hormone receptor [Plakobranchus ocellatus]